MAPPGAEEFAQFAQQVKALTDRRLTEGTPTLSGKQGYNHEPSSPKLQDQGEALLQD